jgi:hypothetical protein
MIYFVYILTVSVHVCVCVCVCVCLFLGLAEGKFVLFSTEEVGRFLTRLAELPDQE